METLEMTAALDALDEQYGWTELEDLEWDTLDGDEQDAIAALAEFGI